MGQKVNPHGLRVGVIAGWDAQWYANKKDFSKFILEDHKIREYIKKKYYTYGISKVYIERAQDKIVINIHTSKPGMLIGTKGAGVEQLKKELVNAHRQQRAQFSINILEVKRPDMDALLVAESVAAAAREDASSSAAR